MSTQERTIAPRRLTQDEIDTFHRNGWVRLNQLITEEEAGLLLADLKEKMGDDGLAGDHPEGGTSHRWRVYAPLSVVLETGEVRDPLFHSFSHSRELGELGEALLGTKSRYWIDQSLVKPPAGNEGSGETAWHIDIGDKENSPFRPAHQINLWMALAEVTPEHGSMRFVSKDDISDEVTRVVEGRPVEETYPDLKGLGVLSEPLTLRPGDATVHGGSAFHSAPPNRTDTPRWGYFVSLFPHDTVYSGQEYWPMVGVEGVEEGKPFPDFRFPVL